MDDTFDKLDTHRYSYFPCTMSNNNHYFDTRGNFLLLCVEFMGNIAQFEQNNVQLFIK